MGVSSVLRRLKRTHHRRITKKVGLVTFMHYDLGFFDEEAIGDPVRADHTTFHGYLREVCRVASLVVEDRSDRPIPRAELTKSTTE